MKALRPESPILAVLVQPGAGVLILQGPGPAVPLPHPWKREGKVGSKEGEGEREERRRLTPFPTNPLTKAKEILSSVPGCLTGNEGCHGNHPVT